MGHSLGQEEELREIRGDFRNGAVERRSCGGVEADRLKGNGEYQGSELINLVHVHLKSPMSALKRSVSNLDN